MSGAAGLVSIVVVNWNGMEYLPECLASLAVQTYSPVERLVVDNASTDGSREWLRSNPATYDRLIELDCNRGFAGGANAGIRASRGEFLALLNNDAVADPAWIASVLHPAGEARVGMVASKILFHDRPRIIDKVGHLFYPDGLNRGKGAGDLDMGQFDADREALFPDGCAALYRRGMLDDVGLFDEQFFAYGDDADLGLRGRWRGWHCAFASQARVFHRHSRSLGKYSPEKAFLVERNRFWVAVKLLPLPLLCLSPVLTLWRFFWHAVSVVASKGLAGGVTRDHSKGRLLISAARAYWAGFSGLPQILKKRREVFRRRTLSDREFYALLRRYRISARDLALKD